MTHRDDVGLGQSGEEEEEGRGGGTGGEAAEVKESAMRRSALAYV